MSILESHQISCITTLDIVLSHTKIFFPRDKSVRFDGYNKSEGWIVFKLFSQILCLEWSFNKQYRKAIQKTNSIIKQKLELEIQSIKVVI